MKTRSQIYIFLILIIFAVGGESVTNKIAFSQTNTLSRNIINSKQKDAFKCPKAGCRKPASRSPLNINIINPSSIGYLLGNKPLLSWSKVPGANKYTVYLKQAGKIIWELKLPPLEKPKISYPSDKPPLEEDKLYELVVEASVNEEPKIGSIQLELLSQKKRQNLEIEKQKIINLLKLSKEEKTIKLAHLYSDNKLFTDAIAILKEENPTVPVLLMLGDLYIKVEQPSLAENYYRQALDRAKTLNDKAEAQFGLGDSNSGQDNLKPAIDWFLKAYDSYEKLGKREIITDITKYLGELYEDSGNKNEAIRWYQQARDGYKELREIKRQNYVEEKLRNLNR